MNPYYLLDIEFENFNQAIDLSSKPSTKEVKGANFEKQSKLKVDVKVAQSEKTQKKKRKHRALKPSQKFSDQYSEVNTIQAGAKDKKLSYLICHVRHLREFRCHTEPL